SLDPAASSARSSWATWGGSSRPGAATAGAVEDVPDPASLRARMSRPTCTSPSATVAPTSVGGATDDPTRARPRATAPPAATATAMPRATASRRLTVGEPVAAGGGTRSDPAGLGIGLSQIPGEHRASPERGRDAPEGQERPEGEVLPE